ncbi:pyridoxamine 5'-phosphate oxidase family protein [Thalassococcus sp. S3]|uniref:pyridoxamine 5'-phosphate oxidase family protein n=1 Tax=Thalassococcus sp. S3 TaxID=2017482 RepID=UPI0010240007|nr:pyridoxamine 5'-phosphate oxidase family protein [Thalassococcus sp. S3]QBF31474.1 pyridoxamine 5'-phosphate oxidase [Thalassococcus sp. S3]
MTESKPAIPSHEEFYTDAQRKLQSENGHEKLSHAVIQAIARNELEEYHIEYIETRDYFFLSTVTADGEPTVSYKGGPVGFVKSLGNNTLVFPNYDGNGMWLSMGNIDAASKVGMLFIDFETPWRLRVQGDAKVSKDPDLMAHFPGCNMVAVVNVTRVFQNCARMIHKHKRVEPHSIYVPDADGKQPYPAWKRIDAIQDYLHPDDKGRAATEGGTISEEEYMGKVMDGSS